MPPVYITEQGAKLRVRNQCLIVEREETGETLYKAPLGTVSQINLFGNIGISTPAIGVFLEREIDVVFLDRNGNFRGRLMPGIDSHAELRQAQYAALSNEKFTQVLASGLIRAKIRHQRLLLQRSARKNDDSILKKSIDEIAVIDRNLHSGTSPERLRGLEGAAAGAYFEGLRLLISPEWGFTARRQHPAPDPVNAMLSFGYTILMKQTLSAIHMVGLDPYAGIFHTEYPGRPSLALDLMEEFRPLIDGVVLRCIHSNTVTPDGFEEPDEDGSCRMGKDVKSKFIFAVETRLEDRFTHPLTKTKLSIRQCLLEQVRQVAECCKTADDKPRFVPMRFR